MLQLKMYQKVDSIFRNLIKKEHNTSIQICLIVAISTPYLIPPLGVYFLPHTS